VLNSLFIKADRLVFACICSYIESIPDIVLCREGARCDGRMRKGHGMKGVVFTEFMEMVEARFSADMLDDIIEDAQIKSAVRIPQSATTRLPSWWRLITAQRSGMALQN
jgi:hypothetical protein